MGGRVRREGILTKIFLFSVVFKFAIADALQTLVQHSWCGMLSAVSTLLEVNVANQAKLIGLISDIAF
jgi:hypothetical protein